MDSAKKKQKRCPKCGGENDSFSSRCTVCLFPLKANKNTKRHKFPSILYVAAAGGIVILAMLIFLLPTFISNKQRPIVQKNETQESTVPASTATSRVQGLKTQGRLSFLDLAGEEIAAMETAVVAGNWSAVPTWLGFNSHAWIFRTPQAIEGRIDKGIWRLGDPVGLWQCQSVYDSPELEAWQALKPLKWHSYVSGNSLMNVRVSAPQTEGQFLRVKPPQSIKEPGVFLQEGRVVGWTFGMAMKHGFMWNGKRGKDLKAEVEITEFYNQTFSNVQEAQFSQALALSVDSPAQERLEAFAQGFRMLPRLDEEDKPVHLYPASALKRMQSLAAGLIQTGSAHDVVDVLDEQIILEAADLELLGFSTQAIAKTRDIHMALAHFNRIKRIHIDTERILAEQLDRLLVNLCKNWIREASDQDHPENGWIAFDAAKKVSSDDPELRLLGSELALKGRDWDRAEDLLKEGSYPLSLRDRAQNLEVLITEGRRDEDVVQIRFLSGQNQIPIEAFLSGKLKQKFLLDTGASLVSIPSATAEALGIRLDDSATLVPVSTASGMGLAYEVSIASIEIKGLRVHNVKAIVLDIPSDPELGLLGNSFLKHFQVEIDQQRGILRLKVR